MTTYPNDRSHVVPEANLKGIGEVDGNAEHPKSSLGQWRFLKYCLIRGRRREMLIVEDDKEEKGGRK